MKNWPRHWWTGYTGRTDGYTSDTDWQTIGEECERKTPTIAAWWTVKDKPSTEGWGDTKAKTIRAVWHWKKQTDRDMRIRWGKVDRAIRRLYAHGEVVWYRHTPDGKLEFKTPGEIAELATLPAYVPCTKRHVNNSPSAWLHCPSPDTIQERKQDRRILETENSTWAKRREAMNLLNAPVYEQVGILPFDRVVPKRLQDEMGKYEAALYTAQRLREAEKIQYQSQKDATESRGTCGNWTHEDGGRCVRYRKDTAINGRTFAEVMVNMLERKAEWAALCMELGYCDLPKRVYTSVYEMDHKGEEIVE